jgi:hypothetical protein
MGASVRPDRPEFEALTLDGTAPALMGGDHGLVSANRKAARDCEVGIQIASRSERREENPHEA